MARELTLKQVQFIAVFLGRANGNATEAARLAGYAGSSHTLEVIGFENLRKPEIAAAIASRKAAIESEGIANRTLRVQAQNARWQALETIRSERAADTDLRGVKGASSGFIVHQRRAVGSGEDMEFFDEYKFDKALFDAFSLLETHTAKELGQWTEKGELTGAEGLPLLPPASITIVMPHNERDSPAAAGGPDGAGQEGD